MQQSALSGTLTLKGAKFLQSRVLHLAGTFGLCHTQLQLQVDLVDSISFCITLDSHFCRFG